MNKVISADFSLRCHCFAVILPSDNSNIFDYVVHVIQSLAKAGEEYGLSLRVISTDKIENSSKLFHDFNNVSVDCWPDFDDILQRHPFARDTIFFPQHDNCPIIVNVKAQDSLDLEVTIPNPPIVVKRMVPGGQLLKLQRSPDVNFYIIGGDVKPPNAETTLKTLNEPTKNMLFLPQNPTEIDALNYTRLLDGNQTDMMRDFNELYYHLDMFVLMLTNGHVVINDMAMVLEIIKTYSDQKNSLYDISYYREFEGRKNNRLNLNSFLNFVGEVYGRLDDEIKHILTSQGVQVHCAPLMLPLPDGKFAMTLANSVPSSWNGQPILYTQKPENMLEELLYERSKEVMLKSMPTLTLVPVDHVHHVLQTSSAGLHCLLTPIRTAQSEVSAQQPQLTPQSSKITAPDIKPACCNLL